ncbi:LysE family translocator [uncultured Limnobacter sp.]|uniref:LysE family translocator n=1 Tax=Limnobacter sp. TaxID=2003368 RepID=UPI0030F58AA1
MQHFQAIALFAFLSIITPGPNNLMIMTSSMNFGVRKSLPHFFGIIVGFPLMLLAMGLGLNAVFESLPWFHTVLLVFSLLMMVYLAWRIASFSPAADSLKPGSKPLSFVNAVLFQWVNPKAWFMATAAVALFPASSNAPLLDVLTVALIMASVGMVCVGVWLVLGARLRTFINSPARLKWFNGTMAASLVLFFAYSTAQAV